MGLAHAPRDDRGWVSGTRGVSAASQLTCRHQPRHVLDITWTSKYVELLSHTVRRHWTAGAAALTGHDEGPDHQVGPFGRPAGGAQPSRSTTLTALAPISLPMSLRTPAGIAL